MSVMLRLKSLISRLGKPGDRITRRRLRVFKRSKTALAGLVIIVSVTLVAMLAPLVAPYDPSGQNLRVRLSPPNLSHPLGTDDFGRDVLSRIIYGSRVSLLVGLFSVLLGATSGSLIGIISGYWGGKTDRVIMGAVDILMSFPTLILGLIVLVILGSGLNSLVIAIAVAMIPRFIRLARGPALAIREKQYVEASRAVGQHHLKICIKHILPNVIGPLLVMATLWMATAIIIEASLSFLGLGIQPPTPSWGNMIREGVDRLLLAPWLSIYPGLAILVTVMALNMVGDGLRDVFDPRFQTRG